MHYKYLPHMALTSSYLIAVKSTKSFFDSLITAKAPEAFTQRFIEGLGFKSTNDRLYIGVLKGLGFLDGNAVPTDRYFRFLDQSESKKVLAEAVEEAYGDLFAVNTKAQELSQSEVKNKLRVLTQGKYSDSVLAKMATTFKALAEYADWSSKQATTSEKPKGPEIIKETIDTPTIPPAPPSLPLAEDFGGKPAMGAAQFHYNIQVHLPDSRDEAVYDAIFRSLRRHLL